MKYLQIALLSLFMAGCSGVPQQALDQAGENALLSDSFIYLVETGVTTREQEQAFIRANRRAWHAQNFSLNDVPLPADIEAQPPTNLLEALKADPLVLRKAKEIEEVLNPPEGSGN